MGRRFREFHKKYDLRSYTAFKKSFLNLSQRLKKVAWANTFSTWNANKWGAVIFRNECIIQSLSSARKLRVRRISAERYNSPLFQKVMRHRPHIHVWAWFSNNGIGIKKEFMVPWMPRCQRNIIGECQVYWQHKFLFQYD